MELRQLRRTRGNPGWLIPVYIRVQERIRIIEMLPIARV